MAKRKKRRTTFFVAPHILQRFNELTKDIGITRDTLLERNLAQELRYLDKAQANSDKAKRYLSRSNFKEPGGELFVNLDASLVAKINQICKAKNIPRDSFLAEYLRYLVEGDPANKDQVAPLVLVNTILSNLRHEYDGEDDAPYNDLHVSDQVLRSIETIPDRVRKLLKGRRS